MRMQNPSDGPWVNNLAAVRSTKGYSQEDVALAVGLKQTTIAAIEKGKLSGRKYMDDIAEFLHTHPSEIFGYYDYLTYEEAAEMLGVSATLIARRVAKGEIPDLRVGGLRLLKREDVVGKELRKRTGPSVREVVRDQLATNNNGGLTTDDLLNLFAPFEGDDERRKKKQSLQSILSRGQEFRVDKSVAPYRWKLEESI